jgi:hypothetical protein
MRLISTSIQQHTLPVQHPTATSQRLSRPSYTHCAPVLRESTLATDQPGTLD